jgi:hypothetical protein
LVNYDRTLSSGYILRLTVDIVSQNAAANSSTIAWSLQLIKTSGSGRWAEGPHYWSVNIGGATASGSIPSYDFRNYTVLTLASWGSLERGHSPDGSGSLYSVGSFDDNNSWGNLGDGSVDGWMSLGTLKTTPGTPTITGVSYVSDTQVNVSWTHSSPSNGQPEANQIYKSVNGGPFVQVLDIAATNSVSVPTAANEKIRFKLQAWTGGAGFSGISAESAAVYTTPAAPSNVVATKGSSLNIAVTFDENVAYAEHEHEVWHGTVSGGVTTWDGSAMATLPSGTLSYTHVSPNTAQAHVYRVRAKAGARLSSYVTSNTVQLLVAPNKPTVPAMGAFADKASELVFFWQHNPIDTTLQTAYEFEWSTNGGSSWTSTGKVASGADSLAVAANTHAADVALTTRVRTWGSATTGGSEGTGASPWSDPRTVTYKTVPTATITEPAEGATLNDATARVTLGFSQPEGGTFVKAQLELLQGASLLETLESTILSGITLATPVQNETEYTVRARVQDSFGLWSAWDSNTFDVLYLAPVAAGVTATFLPETGFGQLDITVGAPGVGEDDATTVTITRTIDGVEEIVVQDYPAEAALTFLDTLPTTHGTNTYTVTTTSELGARTSVTTDLITEECRRAYLSKGASFSTVGTFGGNLSVDESLSVASETIEAAGRVRPVGLYGVETNVQLKVGSFVFAGFGSTIEELRAVLLAPGKACYRDPSGRRLFGAVRGSLKLTKVDRGELSFTLTETS